MRAFVARRFRALVGRNSNSNRVDVGRKQHAVKHAALSAVEELEARRLMATYYVSPWGNDWAAGTSTGAAWKSIGRVNNQTLRAGDTVLFQGGNTFYGSLYVPSNEGGNAWSPVKFGSYGGSRATINSGGSAGLDVAQTGGVNVENLNFKGNGWNSSHGIYVHCDWSGRTLDNIKVNNVDVSGYGGYNIKILAPGWGSTYRDIRITNANLHDSKEGGIWMNAGGRHNTLKNVYISNVRAYNHSGTGSWGKVTGNGIFVADADGVIIERSIAYNNGSNGFRPVGIWAAGSNRVTIQYCESYNNKTITSTDGGGFDFDWDVTNSVMQYNYSHDNHGPGFLLAAGDHKSENNVIRYNVTQNDGRRNARGGIQLWGNVQNAKIYNNVVYISAPGVAAFYAHNLGASWKNMNNVDVRNNIFYTTGGVPTVKIQGGFSTGWNNRFIGNAYHSAWGGFKIEWDGQTFWSLDSFRNAKWPQERNYYNEPKGYQGDPKLKAAGQAGAVNNPWALSSSLWHYQLQWNSPLINKGVSQPTTLSGSTTQDFFGQWMPKSGKFDIGAHEAA
jgi:hypothetical protein